MRGDREADGGGRGDVDWVRPFAAAAGSALGRTLSTGWLSNPRTSSSSPEYLSAPFMSSLSSRSPQSKSPGDSDLCGADEDAFALLAAGCFANTSNSPNRSSGWLVACCAVEDDAGLVEVPKRSKSQTVKDDLPCGGWGAADGGFGLDVGLTAGEIGRDDGCRIPPNEGLVAPVEVGFAAEGKRVDGPFADVFAGRPVDDDRPPPTDPPTSNLSQNAPCNFAS